MAIAIISWHHSVLYIAWHTSDVGIRRQPVPYCDGDHTYTTCSNTFADYSFLMAALTNQREVSLSLSWNHSLPNMYTPGVLYGHLSTYREIKCKAQYWNLCTITNRVTLHTAFMSPGHCNIVLRCVSGIQTDQPAATCLIRLKPEVVIHINMTISWTKNKKISKHGI